MVTVVKRPEGHKIIDQAITADITDSGGDALITFEYHALSDGDYVYIVSDIDEYNGFWYVTTITANTFKISEYEGGDFVEYFQNLEIDYYKTQVHDWSSIFLPIVYKISNNRWPINTVDAVNLILLNSDDNGFTSLLLAAPLSIEALEFVKITGASSEEANGVFQVVEVINSSEFVIDLPFENSGSLIGASIQYYYNSYQVKVKIFAGLPSGHPWEAKKPYEEVAELSLTPDENGIVMFSVADYIRGKTRVENNITIYSQPLNLDAFTAFYISCTETFDDSDGYTLGTNTSQPYVDDDFEGYAITGKLPFKNTYSGDYADYVYTSGSPAKWLTNMETLLAVDGLYFDISFIKNVVGSFVLRINKYVSDYLTTIEDITYADQGIGVYRVPIDIDSAYDRFCVQVLFDDGSTPGDPGFTPDVMPALNLWGIVNSSSEPMVWTGGIANPFLTVSTGVSAGGESDVFRPVGYDLVTGETYQWQYSFECHTDLANPLDSDTVTVKVQITDLFNNVLAEQTNTVILFGGATPDLPINDTWNVVCPATPDFLFLAIRVEYPGGSTDSGLITINSFVDQTEAIPATPGEPLYVSGTEEICIDIIGTCDAQGGFTPSGIRLLEDGGYRLLE